MKKWIGMVVAVTVLAGCDLDFAGVTELNDHATEIALAARVAVVQCPDALSLAAQEEGDCVAMNPDSTRVSAQGVNGAIWSSSAPAVASVDMVGHIKAETVAGIAIIEARGTYGTSAVDTVVVQ